ncbi:hypothetical protein [Elioraea tepidiphila]|uniref:hypothetical protein n=1 Tax=Elioraea tepidiphila TaxID=457934 RepID=UPI0003726E91|nr:hypothetical protein [Elioraea tepidiphila]
MTLLFLLLLLPVIALGFTGLTMVFIDAIRGERADRDRVGFARGALGYLLGAIGLLGLIIDLLSGALFRVEGFGAYVGTYGAHFALIGLAVLLVAPPRARPA